MPHVEVSAANHEHVSDLRRGIVFDIAGTLEG
jgi:hypothetical protein